MIVIRGCMNSFSNQLFYLIKVLFFFFFSFQNHHFGFRFQQIERFSSQMGVVMSGSHEVIIAIMSKNWIKAPVNYIPQCHTLPFVQWFLHARHGLTQLPHFGPSILGTSFRTASGTFFFFDTTRRPAANPSQIANFQYLILLNEGMVRDLAPLGKSHHSCITFKFQCYTKHSSPIPEWYLCHKGHYDSIRHYCMDRWTDGAVSLPVKEAWSEICCIITSGAGRFIPKSKPKANGKKHPLWLTNQG